MVLHFVGRCWSHLCHVMTYLDMRSLCHFLCGELDREDIVQLLLFFLAAPMQAFSLPYFEIERL